LQNEPAKAQTPPPISETSANPTLPIPPDTPTNSASASANPTTNPKQQQENKGRKTCKQKRIEAVLTLGVSNGVKLEATRGDAVQRRQKPRQIRENK
jgi:hypothetical protein